MPWMGNLYKLGGLNGAVLFLAFVFSTACSPSPGPQPGVEESAKSATAQEPDQDRLPFHDGDVSQTYRSDPGGSSASLDMQTRIPFARSEAATRLPVGTLLTVRLNDLLSGDESASGAHFIASVEEPVVLNGNTIVARGTAVRGRVESAQASPAKGNRSYMRLTLLSIRMDGQDVPLETSSLFARVQNEAVIAANLKHASNKDHTSSKDKDKGSPGNVRLQKGRFLTFRLNSPVSLPFSAPGPISKNAAPAGHSLTSP